MPTQYGKCLYKQKANADQKKEWKKKCKQIPLKHKLWHIKIMIISAFGVDIVQYINDLVEEKGKLTAVVHRHGTARFQLLYLRI